MVDIKKYHKNSKQNGGEIAVDEKKQIGRSRISQTDVPTMSMKQALRIPLAIAENYASKPASPLDVAVALDVQPTTGPFRNMCGASIAYGFTEGGANAKEISLTPLGMRIVRPLNEGEDLKARREAVLKPRVLGEFLRKYDKETLPADHIALNVLESLGVPRDRANGVLALILENAAEVGFTRTIKDKTYIDLSDASSLQLKGGLSDESEVSLTADVEASGGAKEDRALGTDDVDQFEARKRRIFITHGKNKEFVEPIKRMLEFGELEPVVSIERSSVAKPIPDKVMSDMRSCGAAIIHVDDDRTLLDKEANEHIVLNENVLIEIGAAMALYGRRFVLLVKTGVTLPSNLQGLFEVRYSGDNLDGEATLKLLEAIRDIKNHSLPDELD